MKPSAMAAGSRPGTPGPIPRLAACPADDIKGTRVPDFSIAARIHSVPRILNPAAIPAKSFARGAADTSYLRTRSMADAAT